MRISHSLACANILILAGTLLAAVIVGAPIPLADARGHWLAFAVALVFAAPAVTLAGIVWSGRLALREARPRSFWSKALFEMGFVLCVVESFVILWGTCGIGAA